MDLTKALNLDAVTRFHGEINGEKFWFDAKEEMVTPEFQEQLANWDTQGRPAAEALASIIVDWDVEVNGEKVPITVERLMKIPKRFHTYCVNLILESLNGNPQTPSESAST